MSLHSSERGALNILLIPLILSVLFLVGAVGFGVWAFASREDYKANSDKKAAAAAAVAVDQAETKKDNEFLEREKEPLKAYTSAPQYGSFTLKYPKTWSGYVNEQPNQLTMLMQPDVVPADPKTSYTLKVEVLPTAYNQAVAPLENQIKTGKLSAKAFSLPKVPDVIGLRGDGEIAQGKQGAVVFLPLRDKTIKISAESQDRIADFNNIILPNFEFRP